MAPGQNRVSPAGSPMRRPSGSGSIGIGSPLPDRPKSVENPLTPRSIGSGPHTPSSGPCPSSMTSHGLEGMPTPPHSIASENSMFSVPDGGNPCIDSSGNSHLLQSFNIPTSSPYMTVPTSVSNSHSDHGGGGGGGHSEMIPFPTFSFFGGPNPMGLKGGSPLFSVVNGESHNTSILPEQTRSTTDATSDVGSNSVDVLPDNIPTSVISTGIRVTDETNFTHVIQPLVPNIIKHTSGFGVPTSSNVILSGSTTTSHSGESQNALLKQLLQNTGCASMNQTPSESSGFSLSTCLTTRTANVPLHTSHLSEAATRIPQPTPIARPPEALIPPQPALPVKSEPQPVESKSRPFRLFEEKLNF